MGINTIVAFAAKCAVLLNKDGCFTAHSFCRLATTTLAEFGISVLGLCHAGRWKSFVTAQEYQGHNIFKKEDRADRLNMINDKKDEGLPAKKMKQGHNDNGVEAERDQAIVHVTYNVVKITGEGGGRFSFTNSGVLSGNEKRNSEIQACIKIRLRECWVRTGGMQTIYIQL